MWALTTSFSTVISTWSFLFLLSSSCPASPIFSVPFLEDPPPGHSEEEDSEEDSVDTSEEPVQACVHKRLNYSHVRGKNCTKELRIFLLGKYCALPCPPPPSSPHPSCSSPWFWRRSRRSSCWSLPPPPGAEKGPGTAPSSRSRIGCGCGASPAGEKSSISASLAMLQQRLN